MDELFGKTRTKKKHLVKINFYLSADADRPVVIKALRAWLDTESLPAVSFVQTRLPIPKAKIALDAIIAARHSPAIFVSRVDLVKPGKATPGSHVSLLPQGDAIYISGQAEKGDLKQATKKTLESLLRSIRQMQLGPQNIVALKCFVPSMDEIKTVDSQISEFFGEESVPAVSYVEWVASAAYPIEIEMIASAPVEPSEQSVAYFTPQGMKASPVYSRVARIHGNRRIYISGLYASEPGGGEEQVQDVFRRLGILLKQTGSDFRHLAKATYYVSDNDASSQLNKLRPLFYDPQRPPAASKAMVKGVGMQQRTLSLDLIATPVVRKP